LPLLTARSVTNGRFGLLIASFPVNKAHSSRRCPYRRYHACPAGWVRRRLRWYRRGWISPLVRSAQARRPALRLRLHGGRAGVASPAHHSDMDCEFVFMEAAAELATWRQVPPDLLDQRDAGATSRLVPGGLGAALRHVGNSRHPAIRRPRTSRRDANGCRRSASLAPLPSRARLRPCSECRFANSTRSNR
jgi:hypothetical protein